MVIVEVVIVLEVSGVVGILIVFFLMIRRPPRSTQSRSSAASDVYKRQVQGASDRRGGSAALSARIAGFPGRGSIPPSRLDLSLIHISEPTRLLSISYAVFCLKKKKKRTPKSNEHNRQTYIHKQ